LSTKKRKQVKQRPSPPSELGINEALQFAIFAHRTAKLDDAEQLYKRILETVPDQPDALHFLGVLTHQRGHSADAIELINRSIALDPSQPDRYNNLGNVLLESGRVSEAVSAYEKNIELAPDHADAYNNIGTVYKAQQRLAEAALAYGKAIAINPRHSDAYNNLGNLMLVQGRVREAVEQYCKLITLIPDQPEARKLLGIAYYMLGQYEAAADVYRKWLAMEPDNPVAKHQLAACSGEHIPARASDAYVESTFDRFADSFDAKLAHLSYRAPQLIAEALAHVAGEPGKRLAVLDAGCGTGLCGPLIEPFVSRLVGVDLSGRMLARAKSRDVYDVLVKAELTAYLNSQSCAFDVILSADTLVYFGSLEDVLKAAHGALRERGLLLFTVEAMVEVEAAESADRGGYRLNPHGRYSHSRAYLDRVLPQTGFAEVTLEPATLRMEGGTPVAGLVVTCRRDEQ